ncbi:hypothetical protein [Methylomagnum sp.]
MDKLTQYRQYIKDIIGEYSQYRPSYIVLAFHSPFRRQFTGFAVSQRDFNFSE